MRRLMIFLSLVCISFCSYSQRLNEDGRKVVSHIDIEYSDGLYYSSLDLYYDDCLRLQSFDFEIDFNNQPDIRITCEKKNGTIIRKDYEDGQISKNFSHEYVLDSRGRIIKRMRYDYAIDGSYILRTDNDMEYDDEDRLYSINTTPWSKLANESSFSQSLNDVGRDDIRYYNPNENGDIVWRRKRGKNTEIWQTMNMRINSYGEHINDTNLNFYQLFFNYSGETMYQGIDFMTEWYNTYSKHFLDKVDGSYIVYEYDEQGNLVQFTACNKVTHKPFRKVTIQYLR